MNQRFLPFVIILMLLAPYFANLLISPASMSTTIVSSQSPLPTSTKELSRGEIAKAIHARFSDDPQSVSDWLDALSRGQFVDIPAASTQFYKHIEKFQISSGNACTTPDPGTFCPTEMIMRPGMVKFVVKHQ
ncbi:MAG: hypothetical protein AAF702_25225 [Chloroflexota bacterium]